MQEQTQEKKQETMRSDEELVRISSAGDKQATEELMLRYSALVRALTRRFFLTGGETEDLIQEGMIGLYNAITDYKETEGKTFKNFAYMCVERKLRDALKKAEEQLRGFEERLGLLQKHLDGQQRLRTVLKKLEDLSEQGVDTEALKEEIKALL